MIQFLQFLLSYYHLLLIIAKKRKKETKLLFLFALAISTAFTAAFLGKRATNTGITLFSGSKKVNYYGNNNAN